MRLTGNVLGRRRTSPLRGASIAAWAVLATLAGCAPLDVEPARDVLDTHTGTTVVRLGHPLELLTTVPRPKTADPFAYLAPFATNRMGSRHAFDWLAVPGDDEILEAPHLLCDGQPFALKRTTLDLAALALSESPYARPAPWSTEYYYGLDARALATLARSRTVAIVVHYGRTGEVRFEGAIDGEAVRAFADQAGL